MDNITYKIGVSGQIRAYLGKKRLSSLSLELRPHSAQRAELRRQLDPILIRAAWIIFGTRCLPADLNDVVAEQKWVRQVYADAPKALPIVWGLQQEGSLKSTPANTLVKRAKDLLTKTGFAPASARWAYAGGTKPVAPAPRENEVTVFWKYLSASTPALTHAGWRWLTNLPFSSIRRVASYSGGIRGLMGLLNLLATQKAPCVTADLLELAQFYIKPELLSTVLTAYYKTEGPMFSINAETLDFLRDGFYSDDFRLSPNASWNGIVRDAFEYAAKTAELSRPELEKFTWTAALAQARVHVPGVPSQIVANALTTGPALLEEGYEMKNCLRNMVSYAERGAKSLSLVYALTEPHRATVELTRLTTADPWRVAQVALSCNRQLSSGVPWQAAQTLCSLVNSSERLAPTSNLGQRRVA